MRFWIFWKFALNCLTFADFEYSRWNFILECTNTKLYFVPNLVSRSRFSNFRLIWFFLNRTINFLNFDVASSVRKPKSSNVLPQGNNSMKSVRKQYGNPDSHSILIQILMSPVYNWFLNNWVFNLDCVIVFISDVNFTWDFQNIKKIT